MTAESRRLVRAYLVALALSLTVHLALLGALSALFVRRYSENVIAKQQIVLVAMAETPPPPPQAVIAPLAPQQPAPSGTPLEPAVVEQFARLPDSPQVLAPQVGSASGAYVPPSADSTLRVAPPMLALPTELPVGGGLTGRQGPARAQLIADHGGSPQSEAAVESGLAWIVNHQTADGGWRFNHQLGECQQRCRNPGHHESTTAATALALLPLLGAGHTTQTGAHQQVVSHGLDYLRSRMIVTPAGGDLQEGTMYAQGLAAIALCEAYALSGGDADLHTAAQAALDFIVSAQHPAGGWRYFPQQPGDTTSLGWQWMALKSGQLAGLSVPDKTLARAVEFLDHVQAEGGAAYGYQRAEAEPTPTAIGLLCRMYSGVRRTDPRITLGCKRLAGWGPSYDDMYFNYYATQVLHHAEAPAWTDWNERLRNHLVAVQSTRGHEAGSWNFADYHTAPGGRLCDTALSLMILEVYYRHLPLYGWKSVEF